MLITPDGAEHELRPLDTNAFYGINGGSRSYLFNYYKDTPNTRNEPLRYYSFDGSFLYAVINPSSYSTRWTVYLNDGTKVTQTSDGVQRITDTNGNRIKIFSDTNNVAHYQDEQTGRELQYTYDAAGNNGHGQGHILYKTVGGTSETIDINYDTTLVQGDVYRVDDWNYSAGTPCFHDQLLTVRPNGVAVPVIREIVFPVTEPTQPARKFSFGYNSDATETATDQVTWGCGMAQQSYTRTASHGMGELSQMITPTGAVVNYAYSRDGVHRLLDADGPNLKPGVRPPILRFSNSRLEPTSYTVNNVNYTNYNVCCSYPNYSSMTWTYDYYNDGRLHHAWDSTNNWFDQSYHYDHAARLSEASTYRRAEGLSPYPSNPYPDPYYQATTYDVWGNMNRTGKLYTGEPSDVGTYTNNRRQYWSYDADGNVTNDQRYEHMFDAAGRNQVAASLINVGDGSTQFPPSGIWKSRRAMTAMACRESACR